MPNSDSALMHFVPDPASLTACDKLPTWAIKQIADPALVTCSKCTAGAGQ